jgi:hypothetical protein
MKKVSDALALAGSLDEKAIFEALCKVGGAAQGDEGPAASLTRFLREVTRGPAREGGDDFPDFTKETAEPSLREAGEGPDGDATPGADARRGAGAHDDVVRALLETLGEYQGLLRRYNRDFDEALARRARGDAERDDETIQRLREAQALLVKYPVAGQAAFAALVREGRRFAKTREGQRWKRRLAPSPLLAQARTLFEGVARGLATEHGGALPSTYIDALVQALDRDLEGVLADVEGAEEGG